MIEIYNHLSIKTANLYSLIMASVGVRYSIRQDGLRWSLWVFPDDRNKAIEAVNSYLEENDQPFYLPEPIEFLNLRSIPIWSLCSILIVVHILSFSLFNRNVFLEMYALDVSAVLRGETYRCLTALFLHKDLLHLLSNCVCLLIFGPVVCSAVGWAVGLMLIIFSGISGNGINAAFIKSHHRAIGASTAIFGAIGFICVYQMYQKLKIGARKSQIWVYPASGLALLGILGASAESDVLAHFWGFISGLVLGIAYSAILKRPLAPKTQILVFIFFSLIVIFAWLKPII